MLVLSSHDLLELATDPAARELDHVEALTLLLDGTDTLELAAFPNLRRLVLAGAYTRAILPWVPPSVTELDISSIAYRWLDESPDVARLMARVPAHLRRIYVGPGWWTDPRYAYEIAPTRATRDGWLER